MLLFPWEGCQEGGPGPLGQKETLGWCGNGASISWPIKEKNKERKGNEGGGSEKETREDQRREETMNIRWMEAMLPLGIIAGMICAMGSGQYFIHKAVHGRPKHVGNDMWDVAMERRDKKLMDQASSN